MNVAVRLGFVQRPQVWWWRELRWCPYLFLLSFVIYPSFDNWVPPG